MCRMKDAGVRTAAGPHGSRSLATSSCRRDDVVVVALLESVKPRTTVRVGDEARALPSCGKIDSIRDIRAVEGIVFEEAGDGDSCVVLLTEDGVCPLDWFRQSSLRISVTKIRTLNPPTAGDSSENENGEYRENDRSGS